MFALGMAIPNVCKGDALAMSGHQDSTTLLEVMMFQWKRCPDALPTSWRGSYLATVHVAPILALLFGAMVYMLARTDGARPTDLSSGVLMLVVPLIIFAGAWLLLAAVYVWLDCSRADRANTGAYADLRDALVTLRSAIGRARRSDATGHDADATPSLTDVPSRGVSHGEPHRAGFADPDGYHELVAIEASLTSELARGGPQWALGFGYVNLLRRAHRAEEASILLQPRSVVIAGARYDELRISESGLADEDQLKAMLCAAIQYLHKLDCKQDDRAPERVAAVPATVTSSGTSPDDSTSPRPVTAIANGPDRTGDKTPKSETEARTTIRDVRRAINDYRDGIKAGFVRARNHLVAVTVITSFAVYFLAWLGVVAWIERAIMANMTTYYLVGVVIGLFARLNVESQNDAAVDDFGLSATRLVSGPLMSGVAAVGGIVVFTLLAVTQVSNGSIVALAELLDLKDHPLNLLIAGTFGLTPTLLLDRLKQQADKYKQDLRSSEAVQNTPASRTLTARHFATSREREVDMREERDEV